MSNLQLINTSHFSATSCAYSNTTFSLLKLKYKGEISFFPGRRRRSRRRTGKKDTSYLENAQTFPYTV